jgi:hypothetical protein
LGESRNKRKLHHLESQFPDRGGETHIPQSADFLSFHQSKEKNPLSNLLFPKHHPLELSGSFHFCIAGWQQRHFIQRLVLHITAGIDLGV